MKSDIGAGKPRRRRMADDKEMKYRFRLDLAGGLSISPKMLTTPRYHIYLWNHIPKWYHWKGPGCYIKLLEDQASGNEDTLDTSPLPYSSKEFENMPKARCATCHLSMPVQLLALHAQECEPSSCSDRMDLEPSLQLQAILIFRIWTQIESPATSNPGNASPSVLPCRTSCSKIDIKVACPLCSELFPEYFVEIHASTCREREWCYGYISTGEMDRDSISKEDVTDPELRQLMEEVEIAEPEAMYDLLDRITACGYSGPATWEREEEIIKAIILH
ncbi:E3 ubiquitin-protein ligase RAD18 [Dissostichus eleginoides]|uniref:E3 ubiquitin-protein ligase RAD18 n=1 Tax=Dissostichus eleginoides TaxID=100907 RepID=A0AAD9CD47_DISEL|nr:E3 ubiquitin-protein ligase RAD18 [Dissostichus eleginoides]